jgi:OOP family OmpA-OmpF porin
MPAEPMARLRWLLLGGEREAIRRLEKKIDDPEALAPTVERALNASVRRDPRPLADALFPVMGPAIRRAIAHALAGMMESVNQLLEDSLTLRGLRWRWQAFRTGGSYREIALRHSLVYRVEQVLLVHRESGVLLDHVLGPGAESKGRDMVAGMLTAIQDFARDSFGVAQGESLETMQVGELNVWIEPGARTLLAAVVRGHPPVHFRAELGRSVEAIEADHGLDLADFQGNTEPFGRSRHWLEALLQMEAQAPSAPGTPWRTWSLLAILTVALLVLMVPRLLAAWRWGRYIGRLREEPGIVVTDQGRRDGLFVVRGLRDPLARDPASMLGEFKLEAEDVTQRWEPYVALLPRFVLSRATRTLAPPASVSVKLVGDTLVASGAASERWFRRADQLAPALAGIGAWRSQRLAPRDLPIFSSLIQNLEGRRVYFALGQADLDSVALGAVALIGADILRLDSLAQRAGLSLGVTLVGSADDVGRPETNQFLRMARAAAVRDRLSGALPTGIVLATTDLTETEPPPVGDEERARRRVVLPRVSLQSPPEPDESPP